MRRLPPGSGTERPRLPTEDSARRVWLLPRPDWSGRAEAGGLTRSTPLRSNLTLACSKLLFMALVHADLSTL